MLTEHIKEILENRALVLPTNGSIILHEILPDNKVMKVEVTGIPSGVIAIDMDRIGHLQKGVKNSDCKQICDYLLVCEFDDRDVAIFVELKSTLNLDEKKPMEQLRRSLPLLDYLRSVCRIHHGLKSYRSVDARYSLIGAKNSPRFDKQSVRPGNVLTTEAHADIRIRTLVGSRVRFDLLRSA